MSIMMACTETRSDLRTIASQLRALADPTRLRILKLLEPGELCVCDITTVIGLAPSTISRHLAVLRRAALVNDRREGKWIHYRIADPLPAALKVGHILGSLDDDVQIEKDRRRTPHSIICSD